MSLTRYMQISSLGIRYNSTASELYKAFDQQTKQAVVIKVRSKSASNSDIKREAFEKEIEIAFKLHHPHILYPLDCDELPLFHNQPPVRFVVYPFIEGGSLYDFLIKHPSWSRWPLTQIAKVIRQAASALGHMHRQSPPIVHRDVKPENFLIQREQKSGRNAHVFLTDFGIASTIDPRNMMAGGDPRGTPIYMAPEQFKPRGAECRSDQYALAFMACYLLTGQYPLQADEPGGWEMWEDAHTYFPPQPPSFLSSGRVPSDIDDVILKALSKDPTQRFAEIEDFAHQFYLALNSLPV